MENSFSNIDSKSIINEIEPTSAYQKLIECKYSFLIDVRSKPEWNFVGFPDDLKMKNPIIYCEWALYPMMGKNPFFEREIFKKIDLKNCKNLFFICRSGTRSYQAASFVNYLINFKEEFIGSVSCINIKFGFEGDLAKDSRRGILNGWKYSNLPWKQL